jgi:CubicO group peptidase (beta-lactamase class C family)/D-alanyl-D-alanine dipeptidase
MNKPVLHIGQLVEVLMVGLLGCLPCRSFAQTTIAPPKPYAAAVDALEQFIVHEVADKELPALSIALVDDQTVIWAKGFGFANPSEKTAATAETVYRVGSVSKLFTDIGIMQLVERGVLDLDAPVSRYLPDFKPANHSGKAITLRQLMAHRSGLVREPPVGHYFDPTHPSLAKTVRSLNSTELIYPPETHIKYSNAAIATVGYVLEHTQKEPFAAYLKHAVLDPLGLKKSSFEPLPELTKDLAKGYIWTYHGRVFEAPTFLLGMAPAGSMYSTVTDLARFMSVLFAAGRGPGGSVLKRATLEQMWTPQFAKPEEKTGFGIGFLLSERSGCRCIGHSGAIYGFATELAALPDEKLGVAVVATKDFANAVTRHIADVALDQLLAVRKSKPLPPIVETTPIAPERARRLAGRYGRDGKGADLLERNGKLFAWPLRGGVRTELRVLGDALISDDRLEYGTKIVPQGEQLIVGKNTFGRTPVEKPSPLPARWAGLIGEYGWDHDVLYILEKDGKLYALIEWFALYPLEEISADVYKFPPWGLYDSEKLLFRRDTAGRAMEVEAASVVFKRRPILGENGETFRIQPLRPVEELRREARAAQPPKETGEFRKPELVDLTTLDPTIKLDIRYATTNNFLSSKLYTSAKAYLQRPAALALVRVQRRLAEQGYGLLIHDAYRPWSVTKMFWEATPENDRIFVANPAQGSRHNRGCAVDLTLYELKSGKAVAMVGGYDEMSDRSYPDYPGGTALQRWHRELLRHAMEEEGFTVYEAEWWHFDYKDWRQYPILNLTFDELVYLDRSNARNSARMLGEP